MMFLVIKNYTLSLLIRVSLAVSAFKCKLFEIAIRGGLGKLDRDISGKAALQ
jgi:hypothetical protein